MDAAAKPSLALHAALTQLLRALFRVLLRQSMSFVAFEELAKQVYVDVVMDEFAIDGKKPSISRASILSGLTRKEVQRLRSSPADADAGSGERYNRAARVLTGWIRDADFLDDAGQPLPLAFDGDTGFGALVRRHSGDMPARAVLDELVRVGAVRQCDDGHFELLTRAYVPQRSADDKLAILGSDVADLIATIDHNMTHGVDDPRFQRKVMYHSVPVAVLPALRKLSAAQAQALLERIDGWVLARDSDAGGERARVGLGIHYFEERLPSPSPPRTGEAR